VDRTRPWYVCIVRCKNSSLYTGITNDLPRGLSEHNSRRGGHYTFSFGPVTFLWTFRYLDGTLWDMSSKTILNLSAFVPCPDLTPFMLLGARRWNLLRDKFKYGKLL